MKASRFFLACLRNFFWKKVVGVEPQRRTDTNHTTRRPAGACRRALRFGGNALEPGEREGDAGGADQCTT